MAGDGLLAQAGFAARSLIEAVEEVGRPRLRLGVTGLSRAGKTVFTTALVHALVGGGRLPLFRPVHEGRVTRSRLAPQPDEAVPRFPYETHLAGITGSDRAWPESTARISELRLEIGFERRGGWRSGPSQLLLDIVDYPGEWLLDLPLLETSYAEFARATLAAARTGPRATHAAPFLALLAATDPAASADEARAAELAASFKAYLLAARASPAALSLLPPGRFLMPGDLEGSPALTFAPLDLGEAEPPARSLGALMRRRYEAYKREVVRPFFRGHFARLDRQVVLVDALTALDAGPEAVRDLESALDGILAAFRIGRAGMLTSILNPRADRVLFAATKADLLHHEGHDRLEAILRVLVDRALRRAQGSGAAHDVVAMAAVRATREVTVREGDATLPAVAGVPEAGMRVGDELFDGEAEAAVFAGELPADPMAVFDPARPISLAFPRFRPPLVSPGAGGRPGPLPHVRLDRALQFLFGDALT